MNLLRSVFCAVLVLVLAGCGKQPPTEQQLAAANYGSAISQGMAQIAVTSFMELRLEDPESAKYRWGRVGKGWMWEHPSPMSFQGGVNFGYSLDVWVDAKTASGDYTGDTFFQFLFFDGEIIRVDGATGPDGSMQKIY